MKNKNTNGKINNSSTNGNRCDNSRANDFKNSTGSDLRELRNQGDLRDVTRSGNRDR